MNKFRRMLAVVCGVLMLAAVGVFAAACGEKPAETKYYSVTVTYDKEQGTVTVTPAANADGKYAEDTSVTVAVTPKEDYEIADVKVDGAAVSLTNNSYTFAVKKDTAVAVTFKAKPAPEPEYYEVKLENNDEEGKATLTPPANAKGYVEGESVTLTVQAAEGFEVESVTVNGAEVKLGEDGKHTFTVSGATAVKVTYKASAPVLEVTFDRDIQGTYLTYDKKHTVVIGANTASVDGAFATAASASEWGEGYEITVGETVYSVSVYDSISGSVIQLMDNDTYMSTLYFKESGFAEKITIEEKYRGSWNGMSGSKLTVSENGIKAQLFWLEEEKEAEFLYDCGQVESYTDFMGSEVKIGAHCYYFIIDGMVEEPCLLSWSPEDEAPIVDDEYFINPNKPAELDPALYGTWKSFDGATTLVITEENKVTLNSEECKATLAAAGEYLITCGEDTYNLKSDMLHDKDIQLVDEEGHATVLFIDSVDFSVALKPTLELAFGTWKSEGNPDLVVSADGIKLGEDDLTLFSVAERNGEDEDPRGEYFAYLDGTTCYIDYYHLLIELTYFGEEDGVRYALAPETGEGAFSEDIRGTYTDFYAWNVIVVHANSLTIYSMDRYDINHPVEVTIDEITFNDDGTFTFKFGEPDYEETLVLTIKDGTLTSVTDGYLFEWHFTKI